MMRSLIFILFCFLFSAAYAQDEVDFDNSSGQIYDLPRPVAIQSRRYEMPSSLGVSAGYLPTDSFNKGFAFAAAYRSAIASYLTWEMLSFTHVINQETNLKRDIQNLGIQIRNVGLGGKLDYPRQIYMTGLHYNPLYSKSLLFNSKVVFSETSIFLGIGSLNFNEIGFKPMIAPGLFTRFYVTKKWAINGYFRDYFFLDDERGLTGIIDFGIGAEYKFGADDRG